MNPDRLLPLLPILALLFPGTGWGLKSDTDQPIHLEADSAEIDDANQRSIYIGNVIITQGSIRITGDKVIVVQKGKASTGDEILASGRPATFRQEIEGKPGQFVTGRGKRIEYNSKSELLYLVDDAQLTQEGDTFTSDRITYDRERSLVKGGAAAKGKQRIQITIQSKEEKQ
jgi:lipopolysaccharide export system protein LptA